MSEHEVTHWAPTGEPRLRERVFRVAALSMVAAVVAPVAAVAAFLLAPYVVPLIDPFGR
jgi:hypothetical protein